MFQLLWKQICVTAYSLYNVFETSNKNKLNNKVLEFGRT